MVINMLVRSATLNSFSHPCAVIGAMDDLTLGVGMLADIKLGVGVDVLTDMLTVPIIDVVSDIDVDILTDDENVNGLAAVMPPLDFTSSAPWEEPMSFC